MTDDKTTATKITELKQEQDRLTAQLVQERLDTLATLAGQCHFLGPLVRSSLPDGVLKRRERTTKPTAPAKVRRPKAGVAA